MDIRVSISGRLKATYTNEEVSRAEFIISADRGHALIAKLFGETLRGVMDQTQAEHVHRDATARLAAAAEALPVLAPTIEDEVPY